MDVTFTKLAGRRYTMTVRRERGPVLAPRQGPGYDDFLPHDLAHFVVERELGLTGGAFGRVAAGANNIFWPADPREAARQKRREAKRTTTPAEHADMARSERTASAAQVLWEQRAGRRDALPDWFGHLDWSDTDRAEVERVLGVLDEVTARWHALPVGGSMSLPWDAVPSDDVPPRVTTT